MQDLVCTSCGQTIGIEQDSKDDRYWYLKGHEDEIFCCKEHTAYWNFGENANKAGRNLNLELAYASDYYQDQANQEEHDQWLADRNHDRYIDSHYIDPRGVYVGY